MGGRIIVAGAVALVAGSVARAEVVALNGFFYDAANVIAGGGHVVLENINLNVPIAGVDVLWLDRGVAPNLNPTETSNVLDFLNAGGKVMTEFSGSDVWFNGKFASFQGTLQNGFHIPSGDVCGGNLVTPVEADDFTAGLSPWVSTDPIGVFNVYTNLDSAIHVPLKVLGDPTYGDLPVLGCSNIGKGTAVIFFTDFADFNGCGGPEVNESIMLLNAITAVCVPAPGALAALVAGLPLAARRRR